VLLRKILFGITINSKKEISAIICEMMKTCSQLVCGILKKKFVNIGLQMASSIPKLEYRED